MNLLMLIIILLALAVAAAVFYAAWKLSGGPRRPARSDPPPAPGIRERES